MKKKISLKEYDLNSRNVFFLSTTFLTHSNIILLPNILIRWYLKIQQEQLFIFCIILFLRPTYGTSTKHTTEQFRISLTFAYYICVLFVTSISSLTFKNCNCLLSTSNMSSSIHLTFSYNFLFDSLPRHSKDSAAQCSNPFVPTPPEDYSIFISVLRGRKNIEDISPLLLFAVPSNIFHFAPCCPFQKEHCKKESLWKSWPDPSIGLFVWGLKRHGPAQKEFLADSFQGKKKERKKKSTPVL